MRLALFRQPFVGVRLASVAGQSHFGQWLALLMALLVLAFAQQAEPVALARLHWVDVLGEGGIVLMLAVWLAQLRASRPAGRVTTLLCLGLALMLLGQWVDLLDEFLKLPKSVLWDNVLESSLMPLGLATLTFGLHQWRQEQLVLNESLQRRERLFREHRSLDGVTQLQDASYMEAQIALEREQCRPGTVLMLRWQGLEQVQRSHGLQEAERMLQAAGQLLLLHLRRDDLLCRYAGNHFVLLLPSTTGTAAAHLAEDLRQALAGFACPLSDGVQRLRLPVSMASSPVLGEPPADALLLSLLAKL
jgi:diguanylate cyclase (GGDEF)-like protein